MTCLIAYRQFDVVGIRSRDSPVEGDVCVCDDAVCTFALEGEAVCGGGGRSAPAIHIDGSNEEDATPCDAESCRGKSRRLCDLSRKLEAPLSVFLVIGLDHSVQCVVDRLPWD